MYIHKHFTPHKYIHTYIHTYQVEIDEYRDYEKAIGALKEGLKYLNKETSPNNQTRDMLNVCMHVCMYVCMYVYLFRYDVR